MKLKTLSDKKLFCDKCHGRYLGEDLKEAIKELKRSLPFKKTQFTKKTIEIIDKIFGEGLTK